MIRNILYFGFIHRLGASRIEGRARRHDPVLSRHRATAAGAHFDAARVDVLLRFALGQIELGIDGTFCRQILAFLTGVCVSDDYQLAVGVLVQVLCYVIPTSLAGVVDAPWLHLVGEVALAKFGSFRRRWWGVSLVDR